MPKSFLFLSLLCCSFLVPLIPAHAVDKKPSRSYCKPSDSCWPAAQDWKALGSGLTGKLEIPQSPAKECQTDSMSPACAEAQKNLTNPFYLEDQSGATQSTGWLGAWTAATSAYAVVAENSSDIAAAVNFARKHKLRLVIKGTGHDYLGRSNAPDSLLVWTHKMQKITVEDSFVPRGCPGKGARVPTVTVGAGTTWVDAYQEVTVKHGRYVQGGGCTSVGAAGGFLQGGGFGSWSKKYGIAAAGLVEAEVVTADGSILTANACQNQDLFWAIRGGGGGTFGVVTKATLKTHPLPKTFGWAKGRITAKTDEAFKELLIQFLRFYRAQLSNEAWGEQVKVKGDNSLSIELAFAGLTEKEAEAAWQPLQKWADAHKTDIDMQVRFVTIPGTKMWDFDFFKKVAPKDIPSDNRPGQPGNRFWWSGDEDQVGIFWYAYQSTWIPLRLFEEANAKPLADALFSASRQWSVGLHFNKGQAGASADALTRGKETAMNPAVFDAAALAIIAAGEDGKPGVQGHKPDLTKGEEAKTKVTAATKALRAAAPDSGAYVNEADYFEVDWQRQFWGVNYPKLLAIKKKYDPERLFTCHHCVGSEEN